MALTPQAFLTAQVVEEDVGLASSLMVQYQTMMKYHNSNLKALTELNNDMAEVYTSLSRLYELFNSLREQVSVPVPVVQPSVAVARFKIDFLSKLGGYANQPSP